MIFKTWLKFELNLGFFSFFFTIIEIFLENTILYPFLPVSTKKVIDSILSKFHIKLPSMVEKEDLVIKPSILHYASVLEDINMKTKLNTEPKRPESLVIEETNYILKIGEGILLNVDK